MWFLDQVGRPRVALPLAFLLIVLQQVPALHGLPLLMLISLLAGISAERLMHLLTSDQMQPPPYVSFTAGTLVPLFAFYYKYHGPVVHLWLLLVITLGVVLDVLLISLAFISEVAQHSLKGIRDTLVPTGLGLVVGLCMSHLLFLARLELLSGQLRSSGWVSLLLSTVWGAEGARWIGRRLQAEKGAMRQVQTSWEHGAGFVVGLVLFGLGAFLLERPAVSIGLTVVLTLLVVVANQLGSSWEQILLRRKLRPGESNPSPPSTFRWAGSLVLLAPVLYYSLLLLRRL